jgi:hypothetical protein
LGISASDPALSFELISPLVKAAAGDRGRESPITARRLAEAASRVSIANTLAKTEQSDKLAD